MKILQISNYYYPHIGGIEQVARDCNNALRGKHDLKVICFNHEKGNCIDKVDEIEVIRSGCFAKIASQSLSFSYYRNLKKIFNNFNPEMVIFHYPNPFASHYLLKILKKYPHCKLVIYWHLDIVKQKILGKLFNGQTKRLIKKAERILTTSPNYIEGSKFLSANREKCDILSCCVNSKRLCVTENDINQANKIKEKYRDKTICFAVGRHVPYKGMEYLIKASKYLDDSYKIFIGGAGPLTDSLKSLAKDDNKISFLGKVKDEDLKAYLLACDIFCFPSITKNEAFGIALAEAMYIGKPAVTFNIPGSGVNYVSLDKVTGLEVENRNVKAYSEAIKELASDEVLREKYGKAARDRAISMFTEEVFKEKISSIIQSL